MTKEQLSALLHEFQNLHAETEWIEFKEARSNYDFSKMGKYFSALSNEANLKGQSFGWLIFGIEDGTRNVVGTNYRNNRASLDNLKYEIAQRTNNGITFCEIHELILPEGRVIMFQIPAALPGIPTAWEGHFFGRHGESIGALTIAEFEELRRQGIHVDWSAQICEGATVDDLELKAIEKARVEYKKKFSKLEAEVDQWDDFTFLNKAKIFTNGRVTRAAILLLGKPESSRFISPAVAQISWILKDQVVSHDNL